MTRVVVVDGMKLEASVGMEWIDLEHRAVGGDISVSSVVLRRRAVSPFV